MHAHSSPRLQTTWSHFPNIFFPFSLRAPISLRTVALNHQKVYDLCDDVLSAPVPSNSNSSNGIARRFPAWFHLHVHTHSHSPFTNLICHGCIFPFGITHASYILRAVFQGEITVSGPCLSTLSAFVYEASQTFTCLASID